MEDLHTPKEFRTGILCPGKQHWFGGRGCPNPLENTSLKHTIRGPGLFKETLGEPWVTKILTPTLPTWGTPKIDHHADQICDCGSSLRLPQPLVVFLRFPQSDSTEALAEASLPVCMWQENGLSLEFIRQDLRAEKRPH